ncbi:MAG TPA: hypothetical protein VGN81_38945 [Pseudonocardiaceae bacterium]|jgi:hypothetical protein
MQPGPPYPPQQPPTGQPYPGQPYPAQPTQGQPYPGQPYPGQQVPTGQPGYPQPGFPQGYQQGYQQPPFPGPAGPRKSRTGLIVLIVVLVVVVVGGGTTALVLFTGGKSGNTSSASGPTSGPAPTSSKAPQVNRYQKPPANCTQLNGGPFNFIPKNPLMSEGDLVGGECSGSTQINGAEVGAAVEYMIFNTPNGVEAAAQSASQGGGQQVSGTGFENAPYVSFTGECMIDYSRSNEAIKLQFLDLPGVTDAASCQSVGMTYAQQYYKLIG